MWCGRGYDSEDRDRKFPSFSELKFFSKIWRFPFWMPYKANASDYNLKKIESRRYSTQLFFFFFFYFQRNYPTVLSNYIRNLQQNYILYRKRANNNDYFVRQTILRWLVMFITLDCIKINNFQLIAISWRLDFYTVAFCIRCLSLGEFLFIKIFRRYDYRSQWH